MYGATDLAPFQEVKPMPRDRVLYALPTREYRDFIESEGLRPAYLGPISTLQILARPAPRAPLKP
jgi:hypothetical protein